MPCKYSYKVVSKYFKTNKTFFLFQKSIVAGISSLMLENSFIQSISKFGAINATVASVRVVNNTFRLEFFRGIAVC